MSDIKITNGSCKYGETRKTGDFENKRADVELSFNIDETKDVDVQIKAAMVLTKQKCFEMLAGTIQVVSGGTAVPSTKPEQVVSEKLKNPPKMPRVPQASAPANPPEAQTAPLNEQVATSDVKVGDISSIVEEPVVEKPKAEIKKPPIDEVTDAQLMDATTTFQQKVKNPKEIRKLIGDMSGKPCPPARLIDIPQSKRAEYLAVLATIKAAV